MEANLNRVLPSKSNQSTMGIHKIILPLALTMLIAAQLGTEATVLEERLGTPVLERAGATLPVHGTYYRLRNWWTFSVRPPIYVLAYRLFKCNIFTLHDFLGPRESSRGSATGVKEEKGFMAPRGYLWPPTLPPCRRMSC